MMPPRESTWCWLTNQNIWDFTALSYTRDDLPWLCMMRHEGHRPKMFLWMVEEFIYILECLRKEDRDGRMVLGHKLLLLVCSRYCSKRGEGRGLCCASALSINHLPACSPDTLECIIWASKDTILLECLTWAVYDNLLVQGQTPRLSGHESYDQVVWHLVKKAYKGLHCQCLACTSVVFEHVGRLKSIVTAPRKSPRMEGFSMTQGVREEFSMMWDVWESAKSNQATGGQSQLNPVFDVLKWMREHQCFYTKEQLNLCVLLWLLTNGGEVLSWHLMCRLLSVWNWELVLNPPTYPPMPSQLNIGHWIREDHNVSEHQKWIEGLCMCPPACSWGIHRLQLDHGGLKHDPRSE